MKNKRKKKTKLLHKWEKLPLKTLLFSILKNMGYL